jgi:hypothetical protein
MLTALLISAAAVAAESATPAPVPTAPDKACTSQDPAEILVCGRTKDDAYRIDRSVLEAMRAREAAPPKPDANAQAAAAAPGCVGPLACGGAPVPLVGLALKTLEAASLAATGEDWREAFRTHQDEYRLYQQSQQRRARDRRPKIGFGVRK